MTYSSNIHLQQYDEQQKLSDVADLIETFFLFNTRITKKMSKCYGETQADCTRLIEYGELSHSSVYYYYLFLTNVYR